MTYKETINFLYKQLPFYQKQGLKAYKADLKNIEALCEYLGQPQDKFPSLHIAGTNGKGSSAHLTAATLQSAGYKTGLYTSPHLKDFRERIKINGQEISEVEVIAFVTKHKNIIRKISPSFFEITVAMAFVYFASQKVDIAVVEVGLGGRLDSTNIIRPLACLITNIGYDHQHILGNTLVDIAREKAGIIKTNTPIIISEYQEEVYAVFQKKAKEMKAPLYLATDFYAVVEGKNSIRILNDKQVFLEKVKPALKGFYQNKNIVGVLKLLEVLERNYKINKNHILKGIEHTNVLTNLKGRWQVLQEKPLTVCDVGHNGEALSELIKQLEAIRPRRMHFILGFSKDKDLTKILHILPKDAYYYYCDFENERLFSGKEILKKTENILINTYYLKNIEKALDFAKQNATEKDIIFIGGSNFVVAEISNL